MNDPTLRRLFRRPSAVRPALARPTPGFTPRAGYPPTRPPTAAAGFTLTEVMIALAMTTLLLVGISRIFAITSATISSGQSLAKSMRTDKAIGQTLSADILGVGPDIANPSLESGMLPLVNTGDANYAMPFFHISNFRVATYVNRAARGAAIDAPADVTSGSINAAAYASRSNAIRTIDRNGNGVADAGEVLPIYSYGERNFRADTFGFFSRGDFRSQTGADGEYQSGVQSNESYVWYGHLRVYNGNAARLDYSNAYGPPGSWVTATGTPLPNTNNIYAEQFRLGRMQSLLVEPVAPNLLNSTASSVTSDNTAGINGRGVFINDDVTRPAFFIRRDWVSPTYKVPGVGATRPSMRPLIFNAEARVWRNGAVRILYTDDHDSSTTGGSNIQLANYHSRVDVVGTGLRPFRERARFVSQNDLDAEVTAVQPYWWEELYWDWSNGRYWINPFPRATNWVPTDAPINSKSMAQRQHLLADGCSQFIVEYAGDFVSQNPDGSLVTQREAIPDGVLDFVVVDNVPQTRWYGLPRDVNQDRKIAGFNNPDRFNSPDVIPLCDFVTNFYDSFTGGNRSTRQSSVTRGDLRPPNISDEQYARMLGPTAFPFERVVPAGPSDTAGPTEYGELTSGNAVNTAPTVVGEPAGATSPTNSGYVVLWGPREMEKAYTVTVGTETRTAYAVPQLIRVIVELRDPEGRRQEPLTQEYVYPVRVTGSYSPPPTP